LRGAPLVLFFQQILIDRLDLKLLELIRVSALRSCEEAKSMFSTLGGS
jgi:hypothetical protein